MRAIVLDDEPACLRVEEAMLARMGFIVDAFDNAADAMSDRGPVELAVVDVLLRGGADGFSVGAELESRHPGIHVLYCSGSPPELLAAAGRPLEGINIGSRFIQKPFTVQTFSRKVSELLHAADSDQPPGNNSRAASNLSAGRATETQQRPPGKG